MGQIPFSSKKVLSFGQRSPRNRDEWYTSSPSGSVTVVSSFGSPRWTNNRSERPIGSVIRKPTSRWKTQFPNGNTVWEPEPRNFRRSSLWNDETVVVPVSSNSLLWVFFFLVFPFTVFRNSGFVYTFFISFCRRVRLHQPSAKKRAYSRNGGRRYQLARSSLAWFFRAGRV